MRRMTMAAWAVGFLVAADAATAGGFLGGIGRKIRGSVRDVGKTVTDTAHGVKSDVEVGTGIPLTEIEAKNRVKSAAGPIARVRGMVSDTGQADAAILFFWDSLGQMAPDDDATLQKVVEYLEGTLKALRAETATEKDFNGAVQRLEGAVLGLSSSRANLPATFDFRASYGLEPSEAAMAGAAAVADAPDPTVAEFRRLTAQHAGQLSGTGMLRLATKGAGAGATFDVLDPESGAVLAEGAKANTMVKLRSGIFHFVIHVADVTLYRLNVVVLPNKVTQLAFTAYGTVRLPGGAPATMQLVEPENGRPVATGLSPGAEVTVPAGTWSLWLDGGEAEVARFTVAAGGVAEPDF